MTYIQKAMEVHPELTHDQLVRDYCPFEVFKTNDDECHGVHLEGGSLDVECPVCWNREYSNEEVIW